MNYTSLLYSQANSVATITFNRPQARNALDEVVRHELQAAVARARVDDAVKAVVIAANGPGFSAGTDLGESAKLKDTHRLFEEYQRAFTQIQDCPKPVIAAVQGVCAGIGASLALACDLVVMGESAFIYLAFANLGFIPDGGICQRLVRQVGSKRAYEFIVDAARISAQDCLALGLVNKVVEDGLIVKEAQLWGERLSHSSPTALKFTKQLIQHAYQFELGDTLRLEAGMQFTCIAGDDGQEGIQAFHEKRKPTFKGKY